MSDDLIARLMNTHNTLFDGGRSYERKRIIRLLEADVCPDWTLSCCDGWCAAYKGAIKLIEGEVGIG